MAKFFWNLIHGRSNMDKTSDPERLCLIHDALAIQEMFLKRKILGVPVGGGTCCPKHESNTAYQCYS